ncbi:MAG: Type prepilin peptidase TadV/CpaA [Betaproteobacteria bacterium]|nr:Type prepilin peptidase TadV/CpaA [Betaproteobacteria bacterium]
MLDPELAAMLDLLGRLLLNARTGTLLALLLLAAVYDCRSHRIPNWLVASGAVYGLIYTTVAPPIMHGTVFFPLSGLAVGFSLFFPLYLLRAMGAGDVKLLAMTGAFLGPLDTFYCALASAIAGGALSLVWILWNGNAPRLLQSIVSLAQFGPVGAVAGAPAGYGVSPKTSLGKLPYAAAIAVGTGGYLSLHQLGMV